MTTYTTIVQETRDDLEILSEANYNLAVAKSVSTGGDAVFNTIYQGNILGPTMKVSWTEVYGINFSLKVPNKGAKVTITGLWQQCSLGEGYTLNKLGTWDPNFDDPKPGYLNVQNNYSNQVCIVLGAQDPDTGEWQAIYFGENALLINGSGAYQPQESVQLWYGVDQDTGTVISSQQSTVETYNMSKTPERYFHYDAKDGKWFNQGQPYPPSDVAPGRGNPLIRLVTFGIAVGTSLNFVKDFRIQMKDRGWEASAIAVTPTGAEYRLLLTKMNKDDDGSDDPNPDINASLKECVSDGDLPKGETWRIS